MAAKHLHYISDVGTTYKRALRRFHLSRDAVVPVHPGALLLIERPDSWIIFAAQRKDDAMRKPCGYDAELKVLDDKAKQLKARKREQLGELVIATGADALSMEQLAGALLLAAEATDERTKEAQYARGPKGRNNVEDRRSRLQYAEAGLDRMIAAHPAPCRPVA